MTPRAIILWILFVAPAGAGLYAVKEEVRVIETQIVETRTAIEKAEAETEVLRAEWSYLSSPERIAALSVKHLGMAPMSADQAVRADALPRRPPPPPPAAFARTGGALDGVSPPPEPAPGSTAAVTPAPPPEAQAGAPKSLDRHRLREGDMVDPWR